MDCHDVRVLLALLRREGAIDPTERAALQQHLDACPDCASHFHSEQVVDAALGSAMRAVTVPAGLQQRVLTRLTVSRPRRWPRVAAAAAAVLLLVAGGTLWAIPRPTHLDASLVLNEINQQHGMSADDVERWYAVRGISMTTWRQANHQYLWSLGILEYHGRRVPKLTFFKEADDRGPAALAQVLVLSTTQFDTHELLQVGEVNGSTISVEDSGSDFVFVIATDTPASREVFRLRAH